MCLATVPEIAQVKPNNAWRPNKTPPSIKFFPQDTDGCRQNNANGKSRFLPISPSPIYITPEVVPANHVEPLVFMNLPRFA
ncbi:MAG: hypothetical protein RLY70_1896 [Planctomycetota bacterium]|jgi:hypothetical protein